VESIAAGLDPERLNQDCHCITLDRAKLAAGLEAAVGDAAFCRDLEASHPGLVSRQPVFLSQVHAGRIGEVVRAIETVARLPGYQAAILDAAPDIARLDWGPVSVFMGYDFHLSQDGPRLIEINTNAGGALINAYVAAAHSACCDEMEPLFRPRSSIRELEAMFLSSFRSEWRRQRGAAPLETVAIVDKDPRGQYLYPEFVLFQRLFTSNGIGAVIAAPEELALDDGHLWLGDRRIDLVYNRVTDFMLAGPDCAALAQAYRAGAAVVTPNPRAHALFANKGNLVTLSDPVALARLGGDEATVALLAKAIPRTLLVTEADAGTLWTDRARYFFKPLSGFGSKGTYRGDKLTKRVWEEIAKGGYVAQELVTPSSRTVKIDADCVPLKVDLRAFTYDGDVQLIAARLYQGQTTNFRTPGGGFAPVFVAAAGVDCRCG